DVDVALFHRALLGQSTIVVATAGFAELADDGVIQAISANPTSPLPVLRETVLQRPSIRSFRALVVAPEPPGGDEAVVPKPERPVVRRAPTGEEGPAGDEDWPAAGPSGAILEVEDHPPRRTPWLRRPTHRPRLPLLLPNNPWKLAGFALVGAILFL